MMTRAEDSHSEGATWALLYTHVCHRRLDLNGLEVFYRECGPPDAPLVLLPHGYPCSSFEFRNLMPLLGDRWRLLAPDFPASGFSATPADFDYTFGGFAAFLDAFLDRVGVARDQRFALYLHDFGTWIGLKLAMRRPDQVAALVVQNGDIYEDALGPKYESLLKVLALPEDEAMRSLRRGMVREEWEREFLNGVPEGSDHAVSVPPELLALHWQLATDARRDIQARVILGESEKQIAASFAEASQAYVNNPTALHLRAMNMLFEGLKEKGALVIVPSSAVDTMNLGALSGVVAIAQNNLPKQDNK